MFVITATELPRFMQCNGSINLEKLKSLDTDTTLAEEGNAAHWFVEQVFKGNFQAEELIDRKAPNGHYIDVEMVENCQEYLDAIMGRGDVELETNYGEQSYEVRGRADHISLEGDILYVDDFKYGWKIVEPDENWTLISHAVAFASRSTQPISRIVFRIFQPRPYHPKGYVRSWGVSIEQLWSVYWSKLQQALTNPDGILNTGDNCRRCPSFAICPAAQISVMNAIEVSRTYYRNDIENVDLSRILDEMKRASEVLKEGQRAFTDLATQRVREGQNVPNYSMQADYARTSWKDGLSPETVQMITGVDCSKKQLITPNQAKKAGVSDEIIESLTERKSKGVKLVRVDGSEKAKKLLS